MSLPTPALDVKPMVEAFFDQHTNTISYVVRDPGSTACAIVDPVMEFDVASGRLAHVGADTIIAFIRAEGLDLEWIIETHVHADHLSGAPYIQEKLGGRIGIGEHIVAVQETFGEVFDEGPEFERDGSQFDHLFTDGETYKVGEMPCFAMHTPGHTPACMAHVMGDAVFAGDTLFMPDAGTARADFPGGDAGELYDSIARILSLPEEMRLFVCHDYAPGGRDIAWETTISEERERNIHVRGGISRDEFVRMRRDRDATLAMPQLILPSLQVNMRAGEIPVDQDGNMFLKVPLNAL
jgi:glyoxylase-like metal-dependent hydrolase (beta-lactamase superfamily II)